MFRANSHKAAATVRHLIQSSSSSSSSSATALHQSNPILSRSPQAVRNYYSEYVNRCSMNFGKSAMPSGLKETMMLQADGAAAGVQKRLFSSVGAGERQKSSLGYESSGTGAMAAGLVRNLAVFPHITKGIENIMADYVHNEITRNWVMVYFRLFNIIVIKDVFLFLVS